MGLLKVASLSYFPIARRVATLMLSQIGGVICSFLSSYFSIVSVTDCYYPFRSRPSPHPAPLLPTIFKTTAPHHPSRIIQYRNAQFEPRVRPFKKQPQPLNRVRYHQPRQIPLPQRSLDADV